MYCKNCGNLLNDQDNFCVKCGSKVIKEVKPVVKQEPIKVKEKTNVERGYFKRLLLSKWC